MKRSRTPIALAGRMPFGILARGEATPTELVAQLTTSLADMRADLGKRFEMVQATTAEFRTTLEAQLNGKAGVDTVDNINAAITAQETNIKAVTTEMAATNAELVKINERIAALTIGSSVAPNGRSVSPEMAAYTAAFNRYFRNGDGETKGSAEFRALQQLEIKAALQTQSQPDGGFTVIPEIEQAIDAVVKLVSPMRSVASTRTIGTMVYRKLVNQRGTASGWVGETDARIQTLASTLSELDFPVMEMYAMPAATQDLLDDSYIDIAAWMASEVELEFAQREGSAFINGDGVKKPNGLLSGYPIVVDTSYAWGSLGYVPTGAAGDFLSTGPADCIISLYHALKLPYRANGTFLMNTATLSKVRKLKDGMGNYLVNNVFRTDGVVTEMMGRPVVEMYDMPDPAGNSYSIAYGDFQRGYLIIDRIGIRVLRDPFTAKPYVLFYTTKRVGGGVQNFEAIKLLKFSTT